VGRRSVSVGVKGCYSVTIHMSGLSVDGEECYFILCTCVHVYMCTCVHVYVCESHHTLNVTDLQL
jgi:hypothetical protein